VSSKPNILYIISDQHNAKCLGVAGHPIVKTPNLDRLSETGVRFTHAITQSPICTPSRICYLSGQYAHNHGYFGLRGTPVGMPPSLFEHVKTHGYRTAHIGKNHTPLGWIEPHCDVYLGDSAEEDYPSDIAMSPYDRYLQSKGILEDRDDVEYPEQTKKDAQSKDARCSRLDYADSVEGWCAMEARRFIEQSGDTPWFMQLSFPRPHQVYSPSEPFWSMYSDDLPMPPNADADLSLKAPHLRKMREAQENGSEESLFGDPSYEALRRRKLRGYYGLISQTDHAIGEVLDALSASGQHENTIVIYTTDHGEYACEFGLLEKSPGICSDAVTRIPHIWSWPGRIEAGRVCEQIVETVDMAPTLCTLIGAPSMPCVDGKDMTPLLKGGDTPLRRAGVTEHPWSKSVRKGPWRMVYYPDGMFDESPVGELYNLDDDPWEMNNLFHEPAFAHVLADLRSELLEWIITTQRLRTSHPRPPAAQCNDGKYSAQSLRACVDTGQVYYL